MNPEGKIRIRLAWDGRCIRHAELQPRSFVRINTLLQGKRPEEAVSLLPMLFSLCGKAQRAAAETAVQSAQGSTGIPPWRERMVLVEALQELLWRFLLDLPQMMGMKADVQLLARLRQQFAAGCREGVEEAVWQAEIAAIEKCVNDALLGPVLLRDVRLPDDLMNRLSNANTTTAKILLQCRQGEHHRRASPVPLMPFPDKDSMLADLLPALESEPDFPSRPHWRGQVMETGPLARMQQHPVLSAILQQEGNSILARLLARLLELDELFARLQTPVTDRSWVEGSQVSPGIGLAWVQNARGLLLHRVILNAQGLISDYRIVAPTEWNFHPQGPCAQALTGMPASSEDEARCSAALLVQSLDPCVSYEIEVDHA